MHLLICPKFDPYPNPKSNNFLISIQIHPHVAFFPQMSHELNIGILGKGLYKTYFRITVQEKYFLQILTP